MKEDPLEQYVIKNREKFDLFEPDPGVWESVNIDLNSKKRIFLLKRSGFWKVAAVLAVITFTFLFQEYRYNSQFHLSRDNKPDFDETQIPELLEAKVYFSGMYNIKMNEINKLSYNYPDVIDDLNFDLGELDKVYDELKNDLKDNISNQEVIEAMILNYRLKLRILEDFLKQLNKTVNSVNNSNERDERNVRI